MKAQVMQFKWTESRGRNTSGWNICSLYIDGKKVARQCGGGYDMQGAAFGEYLTEHYQDRLTVENAGGFKPHKGKIYLDGACGFSSMERIAAGIGLTVEYKSEGLYIITDTKE